MEETEVETGTVIEAGHAPLLSIATEGLEVRIAQTSGIS